MKERKQDTLEPAGRIPGGGVRFYGWAPDPENGMKQRISVHVRMAPEGSRDELLDIWFPAGRDGHKQAEAFVADINGRAKRA